MPGEWPRERREYEAPQVLTIRARDLFEALGPVTCYGPGISGVAKPHGLLLDDSGVVRRSGG